MSTELFILRADGTRETRPVALAPIPSLDGIKAVLRPIFAEARPEHVSVLYRGQAADMFVDEVGHDKRLPRNDAATTVYRAAWMQEHPQDDPESLPWIAGDAVIFSRRVWS